MATAEELLAAVADAEDKILTADLNTRVISIPASVKVLGVKADDDVQRLRFSVPRYYGEFDLYDFKVYVNYENAKRGGDVYPVDDLALSDDNEYITFSWLVDRYAFMSEGDVKFSICMKKYEGDIVVKEFNTTFATLPVLAGLETDKAATSNAAPGVLDTVLMRLYAVEAANGLGQNGYYNVIKMTENTNGVLFTIVDQDGNTSALVKHGTDGVDGHTPVKGVDYFTTDERNEFAATVNAQAKDYINNWAPKFMTIELTANGWGDNEQTVTVTGVTEDNYVFVNGVDESYSDNEVKCIGQSENSLTFKCGSIPADNLSVNLAIFYTADDVASAGNLSVTDDGKGNVTIM